ncbi:MAG: HesA/MoeB/ThiF family protein [Lysobacterales bacterium]|nr:MAG: HesA/MoeB/ThiF family protein [Xanthomonadales bacterium]
MSKRYARQIALADVGTEGQEKFGRARVLVVGLGGLGCPAALYLATSGIGRLVLNDFDRVDETNLPRQILYGPDDVGALKVEAAKKRLTALNPGVDVIVLAERLDAAALEAVVGGVDVVLDGTDNFTTRFAVNRACVARRVPLVSGAAVRVEGQIAVFPNDGGGPCYACLYNDEDEWLGDCQGNGVLAPVPGVIGTLMAEEALKLVLGWGSSLRNRLLLWDAKRGDWQSVALKRDPECVVCGAPRVTSGG